MVLSGVNRSVTRSKYSIANQTVCNFPKKLEYADKEHKTYKNSRYVYNVFFYTLGTKGQKPPPLCRNNVFAIVLVKGLYKQGSWFSLVSTGKITHFLPFLVLVSGENSALGLSWENTDRKSWTGIKSSCIGSTLLHQQHSIILLLRKFDYRAPMRQSLGRSHPF